LAHNQIKAIGGKFKAASPNLAVVDLSSNLISVEQTSAIKDLIDEFNQLKKIKDINLLDNPVMKQLPGLRVSHHLSLKNFFF